MVSVSSVQVRLHTEIDGVEFVMSWWGADDDLRFAVRVGNKPEGITDKQLKVLEEKARKQFNKRIKNFQHIFESDKKHSNLLS